MKSRQKEIWDELEERRKALQKARNDRQKDLEQRDVVYSLLRNAKKRAKTRGIAFTIGRSDISLPTHCPILGYLLTKNRGAISKSSYSLDRIDNSKGYIPGNIRVISFWANTLKDNLTFEQIENLYKYVKGEI